MTHGSLFSGIGGFDIAAQWMGWQNIFHCEWNDFGKRVLNHYWPEAASYDDITKTDFNIHRGRIDVLSGGFPCQPFSAAGKRLGNEDDRHLWPEMLRAIREIQPHWVVGENVFGLTNWNEGLVFEQVQTDLENEGYEVQSFVIPASAVNAPHRRDRVWIVSRLIPDTSSDGFKRNQVIEKNLETDAQRVSLHEFDPLCGRGATSDTPSRGGRKNHGQGKSRFANQASKKNNWQDFPTQPPICGGNDGLPSKLDGTTFSKWRNESIKAYGNAIVPQVAYQIFKSIESYKPNK